MWFRICCVAFVVRVCVGVCAHLHKNYSTLAMAVRGISPYRVDPEGLLFTMSDTRNASAFSSLLVDNVTVITDTKNAWITYRKFASVSPKTPSPTVTACDPDGIGYLFFGGAFIPTEAYGGLLRNIAARGRVTLSADGDILVVSPMAPSNLPSIDFWKRGLRVMRAFSNRVCNWYIGGHSLGAQVAAQFTHDWITQGGNVNAQPLFDRLRDGVSFFDGDTIKVLGLVSFTSYPVSGFNGILNFTRARAHENSIKYAGVSLPRHVSNTTGSTSPSLDFSMQSSFDFDFYPRFKGIVGGREGMWVDGKEVLFSTNLTNPILRKSMEKTAGVSLNGSVIWGGTHMGWGHYGYQDGFLVSANMSRIEQQRQGALQAVDFMRMLPL
eukprot:GDKI01035275.1.p1 GENE.GDKI01035275.1~~GDKI01035275.1.p1  ORF type:complete len:381 (+),score=73.58 GDKI01035275.1:213-1355(+)